MSTPHPEEEFRRVHRLTPLLKFWTVILAVLAVAAVNVGLEELSRAWTWLQEGQFLLLAGAFGGFVLACALVWLGSQVWWQAMGYRLGAEEVSLRQGVLSRQLRTARYDRIQAVDVVESVIARIFGLAAVRVETAGGRGSVIEIAYLPKAEAEALRREVLGRTRAERPDPEPEQSAAQTPALIPEIPIARSLTAAALQPSTLLGAGFTVLLLLSPLGWATIIPALFGIVPVVWNQIDRSWRFTALLDADQNVDQNADQNADENAAGVDKQAGDPILHVSFGLADRRRQSIPLARIHGVTLHQPWLWRMTGWWSVAVSVAGYGTGTKGATTQILPVGTREQAARLLQVVSPVVDPQVVAPTFTSPARARWVSPVDLQQQSVTVLPEAVITRTGRLNQRWSVIEPGHIQELSLVRGPLQQLFGLCTVRLDLVPGPVRMAGQDLTPEDGHALLNRLRQRQLPAYTPPGNPS